MCFMRICAVTGAARRISGEPVERWRGCTPLQTSPWDIYEKMNDQSRVAALLLRGVNVGGAKTLPMAALREMLVGLGLQGVQTYLQSGNAVFHDPGIVGLDGRIAAALLERFGFAAEQFLMPAARFAQVLADNPFQAAGRLDGAKVHVVFLKQPVFVDLEALQTWATAGERFHLGESAFYLQTPEGFGRSKVAERLGRYLKSEQTARNQRSCEAILALTQRLTVS